VNATTHGDAVEQQVVDRRDVLPPAVEVFPKMLRLHRGPLGTAAEGVAELHHNDVVNRTPTPVFTCHNPGSAPVSRHIGLQRDHRVICSDKPRVTS
jgi:hypothetical protein